MPRIPRSITLDYRLPEPHQPSAVELEFFQRIQNSPTLFDDTSHTYQSEFFPEFNQYNRFRLFTDIPEGTCAVVNSEKWHTDGPSGGKDTLISIMSGSMPTLFGACKVRIERAKLNIGEDVQYYDQYAVDKNPMTANRISYLMSNILGARWVEIAAGVEPVTELFKENCSVIQVTNARLLRAEPFVFYSGEAVNTLHRPVARVSNDPQNRLWFRKTHRRHMTRRARPSDRFIKDLLYAAS